MNYSRFLLVILTAIAGSIYPFGEIGAIAQAVPKIEQPNRPVSIERGTEIALNGRTISIPWAQWQLGNGVRLGLSDTALAQQFGVELFNNINDRSQPIDWYAIAKTRQVNVAAQFIQQYRYLDITELAKSSGWKWENVGGKLQLTTPPTRVANVQRQNIPKNGKIVVTLDRHTPWKLSQTPTEGYLSIEATADPTLLAQFNTPPLIVDNNLDPDDDPTAEKLEYKVTSNKNQTIVQFPIVRGQRARARLLSPSKIEVSINPSLDAIPDRHINWAPGVKWHQQWLKLGTNDFPITYLELDPRQPGLKMKPMLAIEPNLVGTNHLIKSAPPSLAIAAINGGYFNRKTLMPLGALKREGKWLSSPILNRGAIGWNDRGQIQIARLKMTETLTTPKGTRLPILALNSGYVQTGIARYTTAWGSTYSPIQANELIVTVEQDKVTQILPGNAPGSINVPIPSTGYLIALRSQPELSASIPIGTILTLQNQITPPELDTYPNILAAGPWLVQQRQIVLDAQAENFSPTFSKETAVRSAIARSALGNIILVTVHDRVGGKGPTLTEMAQILHQMGAVDALNLDGGSSTSLYLGGQLVNRASATAARVHNSIGIFLSP